MHREEMKINQKVESDNMPNELKAREQADIAGPRGLIGSYLAVIKAPAAAISNVKTNNIVPRARNVDGIIQRELIL